MKKYAFMMMDANRPGGQVGAYDNQTTHHRFVTVAGFDEARAAVVQLQQEGFGALELCGAFSRRQAQELMELTGNKLAIAYMVHEPVLDPVFQEFFAK